MLAGVPLGGVETLSDRRRNPFGMRPRCESDAFVPGYGDPSADFHVIGDHPGRHGGAVTGVPFSDSAPGEQLQSVLHDVGLLAAPYADMPDVTDLFLDYIHMCLPADDSDPSEASYARLERFFDAELRAVNAHILIPVGKRATDRVLGEYTTQSHKVPADMDDRHAMEVRGRGFLVVPVKEPTVWDEGDRDRLCDRLTAIRSRDYRQTKGVATFIG